METKTKLIVFDGLDGCGKTTHARLLAESLRQKGFKVKEFKQPFESPVAKTMNSRFEDYEYDRLKHWELRIRPTLGFNHYDYVILDRFWLSNVFYNRDPDKNLWPSIKRRYEALYKKADFTFVMTSTMQHIKNVHRDRGEELPKNIERAFNNLEYLEDELTESGCYVTRILEGTDKHALKNRIESIVESKNV